MWKKKIKLTRSELKMMNKLTKHELETLSCVADELGVDARRIKLTYSKVKELGFLKASELRQFTEMGIPMVDYFAKRFNSTTKEVFSLISEKKVTIDDVEAAFDEMKEGVLLMGNINKSTHNNIETKDPKLDINLISKETIQEMIKVTNRMIDDMKVEEDEVPLYGVGMNIAMAEKELLESMLKNLKADEKLNKTFSDTIKDNKPSKGKSKKCKIPEMKIKINVDKAVTDAIGKMEDEFSFQTLCHKERPKIDRLIKLGILGSDDVRSHNVGASDYSKRVIQPWAIWMDYNLDPFDADIIKRVLRDKKGESKKLDYEKIIHICQEKLRQIG